MTGGGDMARLATQFAARPLSIAIRNHEGNRQMPFGPRQWSQLSAENRRSTVLLIAIACFALFNSLLSIGWGLPDAANLGTTGSWAVDTIAPIGPLNEAYNRFTRAGTEDVIYPLFHYVVLAGAYAPYVLWALLAGELRDVSASFPYGATHPREFFRALTVIAGVVSALMAAGLVIAVYLITRQLFARRAALYAAVFTAVIPPLAYYGMTSNLDVPYLFWTLLALHQLLRSRSTAGVGPFVLCGLFAGLAVATKDQAAGFLLIAALAIPWMVARSRAARTPRDVLRSVLDRRVAAAAGSAALSFALGNNLLFGGWDAFVRHMEFAAVLHENNIASNAIGLLERQPQMAADSVHLLIQMLGYPTLMLALAGLWIAIRQRNFVALLLPAAAALYYVSIIVPTLVLSRYLLGVALLAMPFVGAAIDHFARVPQNLARTALWGVATAALGWQLLLTIHLHATLRNDSRYAMERWVRAHVPAGATIESQAQPRYLPRLLDAYTYTTPGHTFSAVSYAPELRALTPQALQQRNPEYVMVLADSGLSGDPTRANGAAREYFAALLDHRAGYTRVAQFATPTRLPFRQITAGTQPTTILLRRDEPSTASSPRGPME